MGPARSSPVASVVRRGAITTALSFVLVLILTVGLHPPSQASAVSSVDTYEFLVDPTLEISAQEMAHDFGISINEARFRMLRQASLVAASEDLRAELGDNWAGSYIDHHGDGALVVNTTSTNEAGHAVDSALVNLAQAGLDSTSGGLQIVRIRHVDSSLADLQEAVAGAHHSIPTHEASGFVAAGVSVSATVDTIANSIDVVVEMPDEVPPRLREAAQLRARSLARTVEVLEPELAGEIRVETIAPAIPANCSPTYSLCNPALRGGQGIRAVGNCTLGLPVRSMSDGRPYVLTAGHCFNGLRTQNFDYWGYVPGDWPVRREIGNGHNFVNRDTNTNRDDYGIVNAAIPGHVTDSRVFIEAQNGARPTTRNEWYDIQATGNINGLPVDSYLCHTGFTTGTRCGRFSGTSRDLGRYGAFICQGDSGGPVYAQNRLYGLVQGLRNGESQDRYRGLETDPARVLCSSDALYQGAAEALNDLNVRIF